MNQMLDEMLQDRVDSGQVVRGMRGSMRLANGSRAETLTAPVLEPLRQSPTPGPLEEPKSVQVGL